MPNTRVLIVILSLGFALALVLFNASSYMIPGPKEGAKTTTTSHPLSFAVFTFADDKESLNVIKKHTSSNDGYVLQSIRSVLPLGSSLLEEFPDKKKMVIVQSLDNVTDAISLGNRFHNVTHIVYDIENWEKTTKFEKENPTAAINKGSKIVHAAGFEYGITPDAPLLFDNYKQIDWTGIDFLGMQLQRFSDNNTEYSNYAKTISDYVRSKNPDIVIFTQVSFRVTDATEMIAAMQSTKDYVDGYIVSYLPDNGEDRDKADSCISTCTPSDLDKVLQTINNLRSYRVETRIVNA